MRIESAITRLRTRPIAPGVDRRELIAEAEEAVKHPESMDQGLHPHMCVPAILSEYMAQSQPEDFLELVGDLASPEGEASTVSGAKLFRIEDALEDDGTDRNLLERLLQAAIFDGAERAAGALKGKYSSLNHSVDGHPAEGLGTWQTAEMLKQLTGDDTWSVSDPSLSTLDRACEDSPVPLVLKTSEGRGHQMLLIDMDDHQVKLRDPEGEFAVPFEGARITRTGVQTMTREAFEKALGKAYLRQEQLPAEERDPSTWMMG